MTRTLLPLAIVFIGATTTAGGQGSEPPSKSSGIDSSTSLRAATDPPAEPRARGRSVEVPLEARSGSKLSGTASFVELPDGVRVVIDVAGIPPGKHGAHVHEKADCSSPDAKSAGEHYSPEGHPHALPPKEPRHLGDLGNLEVGEDGRGHLEIVAPHANLRQGDRHSFVGRAIVVHAKPDDGSQPSGNSGDRIGCGVIRTR